MTTQSVSEMFPPWDGVEPIDIFRHRRKRELKIHRASQSSVLRATDAEGNPLYKVTAAGNLARTRTMTQRTKQRVIERDGACVQCGAGGPFEIDHIIRYIDGGTEDLSNLQALCVPCHRRKGGR